MQDWIAAVDTFGYFTTFEHLTLAARIPLGMEFGMGASSCSTVAMSVC